MKKRSNRVGHKYLGLHRWISQVETWLAKISQVETWLAKFLQVEIVHFASWTLISQVEFVISQLAKLSFSLVRLSSHGHNFHFSSDLHTVRSVGLLTSQASKQYIGCIKWTLGSARNVSCSWSPLEFLHVRFLSLFFLLAFLISFGKGLQSSKAWILHVNELPFAFPWTIQSSLSFLDCFGDKKTIKNTKTCHNLIRNTCKGP